MQKHAMKCSLNGISITLSEKLVGLFLSFHLVPHISASVHSPRYQVGVSIQEDYSQLRILYFTGKLLCCVCVGLGTCVDMYMFSVYDWYHSIERDLITIV